MKDKITIVINGKVLSVPKGTLLADIINIEKPCGGHGICGKCNVIVNGKNEVACKYIINSDVEIVFSEKNDIVSVLGVKEDGYVSENLCLALDIGTTTIALALISLDLKKVIKVTTKTNPQIIYGTDVMSRIEYCQKNSIYKLQSVLIDKINEMICEFSVGIIDTLYVSANATMLHTFFGIDCSSIGVAPYKAQFLEQKQIEAKNIGINNVNKIVSLPSVASFVGADIVSGMNYIGMPSDDEYYLLVDLGTNAEIVLFSNKKGVCTSAAAGPCFEGANICCGMSATDGAIYSFSFQNAENFYKTINDDEAIGICGTGLIDIISELFMCGFIDESGYMEKDFYIANNSNLSDNKVVVRYTIEYNDCQTVTDALIQKDGKYYFSEDSNDYLILEDSGYGLSYTQGYFANYAECSNGAIDVSWSYTAVNGAMASAGIGETPLEGLEEYGFVINGWK